MRTMFDCAICTVPILGETIVYTPLSRLWISPVMRLPSLSSIVGDASAPAARPSNAAAKQVLIDIFIDATLYASVRHASYYSKREKGSGSFPLLTIQKFTRPFSSYLRLKPRCQSCHCRSHFG